MALSASSFASFIDSTPTPYQLVDRSVAVLKEASFEQLHEDASWHGKLAPGGKYFFHRNQSTLVAFTVGKAYQPGGGFKIVGAHTDSPVLKLKPVSEKTAHGYQQIGVECYGGGLWHTWFDRELSVSGCCIVRTDGGFERKLVHLKQPLLRIPNLCIHLQTADERAQFAPNKEMHLSPIIAMIESELNQKPVEDETDQAKDGKDTRHAPALLKLVAAEIGCQPADIMDWELSLHDTQPAQIWGANSEFLSSPRLDNQVHCYTSLMALRDYAAALPEGDSDISMIALFDHEEVGSQSACGAGSTVMSDSIARVTDGLGGGADQKELHRVAVQKSFLVSADVAHAVHPNYASKHEDKHRPLLNKGTVIKTNDNQRYATNAVTGFIVRELARRADISVQEFVVRNDCPCGTTIGPIVSEKTGVQTVDVGVPSLSMHSIRETIGVADISNSYVLFKTFFEQYRDLVSSCKFT